MRRVSIIGVGRIGGALAIALSKKDFEVENLITRTPDKAGIISKEINPNANICDLSAIEEFSSDVIFIATQDAEIENVVNQLKKKSLLNQTYIFHTSGSLSSEVLQNLKSENRFIGSIHPLVSVSDPVNGEKRFRDAYFCVEGDKKAVDVAEEIVRDLGGKPFSVETKFKSLYHASAVTACGHLVALIDVSLEMLERCGLESKESKKILMPLINSTIENLEDQETFEALTGTFARADVETLEKHIETIGENLSREILEVYLNLGERSLKLAKMQGADEEKLRKMSEILSLAKNNFKC